MTRWHLMATWWLYARRLAKAERKGGAHWHNFWGPFWYTGDPVYRFGGERREDS